MLNRFLLLVSLALALSCGSSSDGPKQADSYIYKRADFKQKKTLVGEIIPFDKHLNPWSYKILRDSILLVKTASSSSVDFWMQVYRYPEMKLLGEILPKGKGPGEFMGPRIRYQSCEDQFIVQDLVQYRFAIYDIDSILLKLDQFIPIQTDISFDIKNMQGLNDSTYLGYNGFFINDERYKNEGDELLLFSTEGTPLSYEETKKNFNFFNLNVTGGEMLVHPTLDRIFVANQHLDLIKVYNKNLQIIKKLSGPDQMVPEYRVTENKMLRFKDKRYNAFRGAWQTEHHVYLLYHGKGLENQADRHRSQTYPLELLKFNWEGELVAYYDLDKYLFEISLSCDEAYLYGTHVTQFGEDYPQLIRYEL